MAKEVAEEYKPPVADKELVRRCEAMFSMARKARTDTETTWRDAEELYMGNHWRGFKMPNFQNQVTLELISSAIDTMIPILTSRPPKIDVLAVGGEAKDISAADTLQSMMEEIWLIRDMQNLVPEWLLDYLVYGAGILKVRFNEFDDLPDADVVDPYALYVNPSATKLEDAEWVMQASPMPIWKVRDLYKNGQFVQPMGNLSQYEAMKMNVAPEANHKIQVTDTQGEGTDYYDSMQGAMEDLEERSLVLECFMRDGTKEYVEDPDTNQPIKKYKYPSQVRQTVVSNGVLLYDGPSRYPFFNRKHNCAHPFPYVILKNAGSAHSFWGKPEPRRLKSVQLAMDRIASQMMDNIHLTANPMWVVDETADVTDQISNKPGSVVRKRGPGQVSMQSPASMPAYVFNFYQLLQDVFETVSGVNKATQGKEASNVTSGVQAQIYRQAATTKIDFKSRAVDQGIQTLGTMWIAMIQNLGIRPHTVNVATLDETVEERSFVGLEFQGLELNVRAKAGSMMPENRLYVENKIMQLAQMGLITDPEFIIENVDLPGKERLLRKMREQREGQQAMEAQQASPLSTDEMGELGTDEEQIFNRLSRDTGMADRIINQGLAD
jgi:hypothetical protein|tara:strand:- start:2969 stop:4789 length:1821 start_codon:yes stop_codon:yes gene_type:complete